MRGEQRQLADTVARLSDAVAQLAAVKRSDTPVAYKASDAVQDEMAGSWMREAARSPGMWVALGAFLGATAATAMMLRSRQT